MRSIEICAGAGGQALGLEQAGFHHVALIEIDKNACETLRTNRPKWNVIEGDIKVFSAVKYKNTIDLLAGGVPCPPFSIAGKQLGHEDDRDLFPEAIRLTEECLPKAVMLENVKGLFNPKFTSYRNHIKDQLECLGYKCFWELIHSNNHGVPQLRPRTVLIALKKEYSEYFIWPDKVTSSITVGQVLFDEMASKGWEGAKAWSETANDIAPTIVGGSKKHGGADLGPTRSKMAWEKLGVDGHGLTDEPPSKGFLGNPKLTVNMAALIQGFPPEWVFTGKKTPAYRQVGNAFPPPVAKAIGNAIKKALLFGKNESIEEEFIYAQIRRAR